MRHGSWAWAIIAAALCYCGGCSRSNNLLLGRVETRMGDHRAVVTDCYRISVPAPSIAVYPATGRASFRFTPCRDADILIQDGALWVNGRNYGQIGSSDGVLVDHGVVSIEMRARAAKQPDPGR